MPKAKKPSEVFRPAIFWILILAVSGIISGCGGGAFREITPSGAPQPTVTPSSGGITTDIITDGTPPDIAGTVYINGAIGNADDYSDVTVVLQVVGTTETYTAQIDFAGLYIFEDLEVGEYLIHVTKGTVVSDSVEINLWLENVTVDFSITISTNGRENSFRD